MSEDTAALDFVLRLGRGLHRYGYPAHRLEEALAGVSRRLGLEGQFFSMPTALFASFGTASEQRTFQLRVEPGAVELGRLARLDAIGADVAEGRMTPRDGNDALDAVATAPAPYGALLTTAAFALTSAAAARFFGGGLREIAVSAVIGLVIGALAALTAHAPGLGRVFEPLAAALAAFLAVVAASLIGPLSGYTATVAGLIVLIPGFTLTVAMIELATRNLVSGTARLSGAVATFLAIGFGFALGTRLASAIVGAPVETEPLALPAWTEIVALVAAPIGFTVLLRASARDTGWIGLVGALAFAGTRLGSVFLGPELGAFVGGVGLGLASNAYGRALRRLEVVPLVPGMLLIVPGSLGFRSLSSMVGGQTLPGVEAAFRMTLITVSLATGVLFANVLLPARRGVSGALAR
jgi:uncharacterized membrane protein YjjP (DUF1212 family)